MRLVVALLLVMVTVAEAGEVTVRGGRRHDVATDLFVDVPLDHDTRVVFPFGGSHHAVPGVVTINQRAPYFCRPHELGFADRAAFVEHLGVQHGLSDGEIPAMLLVRRNQVRYVGD